MDDSDNLLSGGKHRIGQQKNFVDPTSPDCNDTHGHGTHVIRILLRFAPRAQIVVGKVSEGRFMKQTKGLEKILAVSDGYNLNLLLRPYIVLTIMNYRHCNGREIMPM